MWMEVFQYGYIILVASDKSVPVQIQDKDCKEKEENKIGDSLGRDRSPWSLPWFPRAKRSTLALKNFICVKKRKHSSPFMIRICFSEGTGYQLTLFTFN